MSCTSLSTRYGVAIAILALSCLAHPPKALADCANPVAPEGRLVYNSTHKVVQFCDGTNWIGVGGGGGGGASALVGLSDVDAIAAGDGNILRYSTSTTKWEAVPLPAALAAGTEGQIQFNESNALAADAALHWDNTNKRLGLGTATPGALLHLGTAAPIIRFKDTDASGVVQLYQVGGMFSVDVDPTNADANSSFSIAIDGPTRLRVNSAGSVGIGTTTPSSLLHVAGGIQLGDDSATCPGTDDAKLGTLRYNTGNLEFCTTGGWGNISDNGGLAEAAGDEGQIQFNDGADGLAADAALHWDNTNKRLGIGTISPSALLTFGAPGAGNDILRVNNENGNPGFVITRPAVNNTTIDWQTGSISQGGVMWLNGPWIASPKAAAQTPLLVTGTSSQSADVFVVAGHYSGNPRYLTVTSTGNVGIGATAPAEKLEVAGDIRLSAGASRTIKISQPAASGGGNHLYLQAGSANTAGTGGNVYIYEGFGAGGPAGGKIYLGAASASDVVNVSGILTVGSAGPNTGDALRVNAGGQLSLKVSWDNTNGYTDYVLARKARFTTATQYSFDNPLAVGTSALDASAILQADSTTKGFLPPRMDEAARDGIGSPTDGLIVYNTDSDSLDLRADGAWISLADAADIGSVADGAAGAIQLSDGSGAFTSDAGFVYDATGGSLTAGGATVTASAPVLDLSQIWNEGATTFTGLKMDITDSASAAASLLMDLQVGGASKFRVAKDGKIYGTATTGYLDIKSGYAVLGNTSQSITVGLEGGVWIRSNGVDIAKFDSTSYVAANAGYGFSIGSSGVNSADVFLRRDAAGIFSQRNGVNAQEHRLYNTDDGENDEFASIGFQNNADVFTIETEKTGTGTVRPIALMGGNVGIGTTAPSSLLHVAGGIQLGDDAATCPGADDVKLGTLRYNSGNLELCTTGGWGNISDSAGLAEAAGDEGQIQFNDGADGLAADAALHWDNTNKRLGVGLATPSTELEVTGTIKSSGPLWSAFGSTGTHGGLLIENFDDSANTNGVDIAAKLGGTEFQGLSWVQETAWTSASAAGDKDAMLQLGVLNDNTPVNRVFIKADGSVGVGTATPASMLHVAGGIQLGDDTSTCPGDADIKVGTLRYNSGNLEFCTTGGWGNISDSGGLAEAAGDEGQIQFNDGADGLAADAALHWDNTNKRLGIGTNAPASSLHIVSTGTGSSTLSVGQPGTSTTANSQLNLITAGGDTVTLGNAAAKGWQLLARSNAYSVTAQQNDLMFYYWDGSTWLNSMVWDSLTGNVGIGTASPAATLHIADTSSTGTPGLQISGTGGQIAAQLMDGNNGAGVETGILQLLHEGTIGVHMNAVGPSYIASGNVGIGTTSPASRLQVVGGIQLGDDVAACPGTGNIKIGTLKYISDVLSVCNSTGWVAVNLDGGEPTYGAWTTVARTIGTSYQNTTGKALMVTYNQTGNNSSSGTVFAIDVSVNGSTWVTVSRGQTALYDDDTFLTAIIPPEHYYRFTKTGPNTAATYSFAELELASSTASGGGLAEVAGDEGQIQFNDGADGLAADAALHWDNTAKHLGIGTPAPNDDLHISGSSAKVSSRIQNALDTGFVQNAVQANGSTLYYYSFGSLYPTTADMFRPSGSSVQGAGLGGLTIGASHASGSIDFYTAGTGAANNRLTIGNTGNVGIGTTSPASRLHVAGGIQIGDDTATCPGASNVKIGALRFSNGNLELCTTGGWGGISGGGSTTLHYTHINALGYTPSTNSTVPLGSTLASAGTNITANTSTNRFTLAAGKTYRLVANMRLNGGNYFDYQWYDVTGSALVGVPGYGVAPNWSSSWGERANALAYVTPSVDTTYELRVTAIGGSATTAGGSIWIEALGGGSSTSAGTAGQIQFNDGANAMAADTALHWDNTNKRLGIGTSSPSYKLHVAGQVAGNAAYVNTSDARLKTDVRDLTEGLETVLRLRPVYFQWKDQKEDWQKGRKLGLIAQEAEQVLPEIVSTAHDEMRTKSIAYGDLTPVLIKAVQELKADNDNLRAELNAANDNYATDINELRALVEEQGRQIERPRAGAP